MSNKTNIFVNQSKKNTKLRTKKMINGVLSISGKPGLFRLISRGNNMLIVESIADKHRMPAYAKDKVVSLADVAIYTDNGETPLSDVFELINKKESGKAVSIDLKDKEALKSYFAEVLPAFDRERVYANDIKKVISWYNILIGDGVTDFSVQTEEEGKDKVADGAKETKSASKSAGNGSAPKVSSRKPAGTQKSTTVRKSGK